MYCYEIIFAVEGKNKKITDHSESIVADNGFQVLNYVKDRLRLCPDELVAIIRRNPVLKIIDQTQKKLKYRRRYEKINS